MNARKFGCYTSIKEDEIHWSICSNDNIIINKKFALKFFGVLVTDNIDIFLFSAEIRHNYGKMFHFVIFPLFYYSVQIDITVLSISRNAKLYSTVVVDYKRTTTVFLVVSSVFSNEIY